MYIPIFLYFAHKVYLPMLEIVSLFRNLLLLCLQVKSVYLEHVPLSWNKGNIEECCKSYGEIQEVRLLKKSKKKIAFVEFSFRKSALACVEGINSAKIGGEVKVF
jgi:hypothetical protein